MDILGIGPLEFLFILIIALIVLGPKDMVKAGRSIGRTLRMIVSSETWRVVQQASREIRNLPNRMMKEAALDDLQKELPNPKMLSSQMGLDDLSQSIKKDLSADLSPWTTPPPTIGKPEAAQQAATDETLESPAVAGVVQEAETQPKEGQQSSP